MSDRASFYDRAYLERLIFGEEGRRFTQDSPVLPDVWIAYGQDPCAPQSLLLTPHKESSPGVVGSELRRRLAAFRGEDGSRPPPCDDDGRRVPARVAYTGTYVVADLYFDEVVCVALPMTDWWRRFVAAAVDAAAKRDGGSGGRTLHERLSRDENLGRIVGGLRRLREVEAEAGESDGLAVDLLWMIRIVGSIALAARVARGDLPAEWVTSPETIPEAQRLAEIVAATATLVADLDEAGYESPPLWLVHRNRALHLAVTRSSLAVKADAARLLFNVRCHELVWAVIDGGVDARHPAFAPLPAPGAELTGPEPAVAKRLKSSRVRQTYDFTRVRTLLDPDLLGEKDPERLPAAVRPLLTPPVRREGGDERAFFRAQERYAAVLEARDTLREHLKKGREVDWDLLEPLLRVPHDDAYEPPLTDHGTHVGGILGGHWLEHTREGDQRVYGVCPDIRLLDLRVYAPPRPAGESDAADGNDEFPVLAALQFVRHLNSKADVPVVHGVNLSLSLLHEVSNYACGRTPVCEECERLVASGVVVVAAAGNYGHLRYLTLGASGAVPTAVEGYHTVSITDPGNAEAVITVGATHRSHPHAYGVSYFSSRGPTGDGRRKPDLVAPGEKVNAPVLGDGLGRKDGTSMAAPHVSGAAAMLMARHHELVGDPRRVKRILCDTATDLGREPYFQGHGMLDVLRALQSI